MGYKRLISAVVFFSIVFSIVNIASAQIILSQPKTVYSLGDELNLEIKLDSLKIGYLDINLLCANDSANVYHNVPDSTTISLNRKLIPAYIQELNGNCNIEAVYGNEKQASQTFEISNRIEIVLQTEEVNIEAGKNLEIKGSVYKDNNELVNKNAFVNAVLNENMTLTESIKDSQFTLSFNVPENTHAGIYPLKITAYENDEENNLLNHGESSMRVNVLQKPARLGIAIDKTLISPLENITIMPFIYDKAGDEIKDQVSLKILDSSSKVVYQTFAQSEDLVIYQISSDNLPGTSKVIIQEDNLTSEKTFDVREYKMISAEVSDSKVVIKNIGNVVYIGSVEVKIGSESFFKDVNLGYGEKISFDLSAPDGAYDVSVNDGTNPLIFKEGVSLTGDSINLRNSGVRMTDFLSRYPIVWIFIAAVVILFSGVSYRKYEQNKRVSYPITSKEKTKIKEIKKKGGIEIINSDFVRENIASGENIRKAEQVTILHGKTHPTSVIAIKVKGDLAGIAKDNLKEALESGYRKKAVSCEFGEGAILLFCQSLTKNPKNEETAVKVALEIDNFLREHNRKFRNDTIEYGIGVNSGELLNRIEGKVLQFANINKTINIAKKVAELAQNEVLLSKDIREKTASSIKTDRVASGTMELYSVKRIVNNDEAQKFINEFTRRNNIDGRPAEKNGKAKI